MNESIGDSGEREKLLVSIHQLADVVLEKLKEGSREKTLDAGQIRLLGGVALRVLRLWKQTLPKQGSVGRQAREAGMVEEKLTRVLQAGVRNGRQARADRREQDPGRTD